MSCTGCGNKERYKGMVKDSSGIGQGEGRGHSLGSDLKEEELLFGELNKMPFEELEKIKKESDDSFYDSFVKSFNYMSDDFKASQILNLVDIVNGERFSPQGHSPIYCIKLLRELLSLQGFMSVNERFPNLKGQIEKRFNEIQNNKLKV